MDERSLDDLKAELAKLQEQFNTLDVFEAREKAKSFEKERDSCYKNLEKARKRVSYLFTDDGSFPSIYHDSCSQKVESNILPEIRQKLSKTINLKVLKDSQVENIVRKLVALALVKDSECIKIKERIKELENEIAKLENIFHPIFWGIKELEIKIENWKAPEIVKAEKQVFEQNQTIKEKKLLEREEQYNKAISSLEELLKEFVSEKA